MGQHSVGTLQYKQRALDTLGFLANYPVQKRMRNRLNARDTCTFKHRGHEDLTFTVASGELGCG